MISLEQPARYKPVKDISIGGIIMMKKIDGEGGAAGLDTDSIFSVCFSLSKLLDLPLGLINENYSITFIPATYLD